MESNRLHFVRVVCASWDGPRHAPKAVKPTDHSRQAENLTANSIILISLLGLPTFSPALEVNPRRPKLQLWLAHFFYFRHLMEISVCLHPLSDALLSSF